MTHLKYGIFAEDAATRVFLEVATPKLLTHLNLEIGTKHTGEHCEDFTNQEQPKNGLDGFKKAMIPALTKAMIEYKINLCFLARDCDEKNLLSEFEGIKSEIPDVQSPYAVICIPQKCIESWVWYCKESFEKLPPEDIEDLGNTAMKIKCI